jgi:prepilin-type N-terminal cleavage/methylation domain-containing protein
MMRKRAGIARQDGLTLVELLVTLVILATLILIALPDYLNTILPGHRVRAAARDVMTDMRLARMRSVSRNLEYRIVFTPGSDSYVIEAGNRSRGSTGWTQEGTTRDFSDPSNPNFHKNVSISRAEPTAVVYYPTGGVNPAPSVSLHNPKAGTWIVSGSIAGRVELNKSNG